MRLTQAMDSNHKLCSGGLTPPSVAVAGGINPPLHIVILFVMMAGLTVFAPRAATQNPETLLPAQSAAKAKELIQKTIHVLGGQPYLDVRDVTCSGRLAGFDRQGDVGGYTRFIDYVKLPNKERTEYYKQRNLITVYNADKGWELDRGGVQDVPAERMEQNQQDTVTEINYILRYRLSEEGMVFRYRGTDLVDLKEVDVVEIGDHDRRTYRIAIDRATSLPLRLWVTTRDAKTRERVEEIYYFSNYQVVQGLPTALQVARERNARKVYQVFFEECQYNTGLADSLFTRESLEQRFGELDKGKKKEKEKKKQNN